MMQMVKEHIEKNTKNFFRHVEETGDPIIITDQNKPNHSILDIQGLGAEIWKGIDAQEYVKKERESWD